MKIDAKSNTIFIADFSTLTLYFHLSFIFFKNNFINKEWNTFKFHPL